MQETIKQARNSDTALFRWVIGLLVGAVIALVAALWGITWQTACNDIDAAKVSRAKLIEKDAEQDQRLTALETNYDHIMKKLNDIHTEVKGK